MINGAHAIIYSARPDEDREFFRDVLELEHVDVGDGWLIFGLPPSEVAVHPAAKNGLHELYLMCEDVELFVAAMKRRGVTCGAVMNRGWGLLTEVTLPGGGKLGVYQPRHARPGVVPKAKAKAKARPKAKAKPKAKAAKKAKARR
jgi:hypothetical protein